jgi:hypothetical protein
LSYDSQRRLQTLSHKRNTTMKNILSVSAIAIAVALGAATSFIGYTLGSTSNDGLECTTTDALVDVSHGVVDLTKTSNPQVSVYKFLPGYKVMVLIGGVPQDTFNMVTTDTNYNIKTYRSEQMKSYTSTYTIIDRLTGDFNLTTTYSLTPDSLTTVRTTGHCRAINTAPKL